MKTSKQKQQTWSIVEIMIGVGDPIWIDVQGKGVQGLQDRDRLLIDRTRRKPKDGDFVVYETAPNKFTIHHFDSECEYEGVVYGIAVAVVRRFPRTTKRRKSSNGGSQNHTQLASLQRKLDNLERLPENEAQQFRLLTEIHKLETETGFHIEEWPNVIG